MIPLPAARAWLASRTPLLPAESIPLRQAHARSLATPIVATPFPPVATAAIDGQALRATETDGASDYAPLPIGGAPITAGTPLPPGADAVLPLTDLDTGPTALSPVARGSGVTPAGHDIPEGWTLPAGAILTPLHLAALARLGHATIAVTRRPRIALKIATPKSGPDALTPMLHALLAAQGADVATETPDLILHAGRSGPGPDDTAIAALDSIHARGIAIRPGETTSLGAIGPTPAILLPGAPLACATVFTLLVAPALRRMAGRPEPASIQATLIRKIASALGQIDAIHVRLDGAQATPTGPAEGGSLAAAAASNGLVLVPEGSEGYPSGATVQVLPI